MNVITPESKQEISKDNKFIIKFLDNLHILVVAYLGLGPFITPDKYLHLHIFLTIIVLLLLLDPSGMCILTRLTYYYKTKKWNHDKQNIFNKPEFFRPLFNNCFGTNFSREIMLQFKYFIIVSVLLISFTRYYFTFRK